MDKEKIDKLFNIIVDVINKIMSSEVSIIILILIVVSCTLFWVFSGFPNGNVYADTTTVASCDYQGGIGIYREYILGKDELIDCAKPENVDEILSKWKQVVKKLDNQE